MKNGQRTLSLFALALIVGVLPAAADVYTIELTNGTTFETRYRPREDAESGKVMLLTEVGNWIALPKEMVADITSETETKGFGTVIDNSTISLGVAPNDMPDPSAEGAEQDAATKLLSYLQDRDSAGQRDYSVEQFVTTENAGTGGLPVGGVYSGSSNFPVGAGGTAASEPPASAPPPR